MKAKKKKKIGECKSLKLGAINTNTNNQRRPCLSLNYLVLVGKATKIHIFDGKLR